MAPPYLELNQISFPRMDYLFLNYKQAFCVIMIIISEFAEILIMSFPFNGVVSSMA
jgi:hypothetical protein